MPAEIRFRLTILVVACASLLAAPAGANAAPKGTHCEGAGTEIMSGTVPGTERTMLCLVNVYRASADVPLLTKNAELDRAARKHSRYMESAGRFGHTGIGDGSPSERARAAGFRCGPSCVGENIAYSSLPETTPAVVFEAWRNSPSHNAAMLDRDYVTAGTGFAVGPHFGTTETQNFASVSRSGSGTASNLLTSHDCRTARARRSAAHARLKRARRKLAAAVGPAQEARAKLRLRRAKLRVQTQAETTEKACDLTY